MPTKIIRFVASSVVYRMSDEAPWYAFVLDTGRTTAGLFTGDHIPVGDLLPGMRVRGHAGPMMVQSIETAWDDEDLPEAEGWRPEEEGERPARVLAIGDEIGGAFFNGLVVSSIDFDASFVGFSCGIRLPFHVVTMQFSFSDNSDVLLPVNLRQAVPLHAEAHRVVTVYHIDIPGWYEIPLIGPYNLSHVEPDTYISLGPEGLTSHEGPRFRDMFDITYPGKPSAPEQDPPSLRERLLDD